jgi:hypothetical protein
MNAEQKSNFYESLKNHQIRGRGIVWFAQQVELTASENTFLPYPVKGVLIIAEQGTDLNPIVAIFHRLKPDGSLNAPVSVPRPEYRSATL